MGTTIIQRLDDGKTTRAYVRTVALALVLWQTVLAALVVALVRMG